MSTHAAEGAAFISKRNYPAAIEAYTAALRSLLSPFWLIQRSVAYQRTKNYAAALQDAEAAILVAKKRGMVEVQGHCQVRRAMALYGLRRVDDSWRVMEWVWSPNERAVEELCIWQAYSVTSRWITRLKKKRAVVGILRESLRKEHEALRSAGNVRNTSVEQWPDENVMNHFGVSLEFSSTTTVFESEKQRRSRALLDVDQRPRLVPDGDEENEVDGDREMDVLLQDLYALREARPWLKEECSLLNEPPDIDYRDLIEHDQALIDRLFEDEKLHFTDRCLKYEKQDINLEAQILHEYLDWADAMYCQKTLKADPARDEFYKELARVLREDCKEVGQLDEVKRAINAREALRIARSLGISSDYRRWNTTDKRRFLECNEDENGFPSRPWNWSIGSIEGSIYGDRYWTDKDKRRFLASDEYVDAWPVGEEYPYRKPWDTESSPRSLAFDYSEFFEKVEKHAEFDDKCRIEEEGGHSAPIYLGYKHNESMEPTSSLEAYNDDLREYNEKCSTVVPETSCGEAKRGPSSPAVSHLESGGESFKPEGMLSVAAKCDCQVSVGTDEAYPPRTGRGSLHFSLIVLFVLLLWFY